LPLCVINVALVLPLRNTRLNVRDLRADAVLQRPPMASDRLLNGGDALLQTVNGSRCCSSGAVAPFRGFSIRLFGDRREVILHVFRVGRQLGEQFR
jgi:hypothetical protein